ncbi:sirohydrochlorin chelatase [Paenibacillus sanguinis]|uniref:sirohydrochlorin chelatase n=1 Tax=Paenibacillus sanguinis TaxID=225906 RepID=UPI00036F1250|nr:CbiX/SirB N-terminal domain-containing protein [Paenibacillus sanguinis]
MVSDKLHPRLEEISSGLGVLRKPGVLVISHGSADHYWVSLVDEAVEAARAYLPAELPVYSSYLELVPGRLIQDGINSLEAQGVTDMIVIPFFVSSGSTHIDEIAYALGVKAAPEKETEMKRLRVSARVLFGDPVDDDPLVAELVWDKVKTLSVKPEREVLLLVGHGSRHTAFLQRWERGITSLAERTGQLSGLAAADVAFLSPDTLSEKVRYWTKERNMEVLVAPLFLSSGYFTKRTIPGRLEGHEGYRYAGESLLPHPLLARWMSQQILNIMKLFTL